MSEVEDRLEQARLARDGARAALDERVEGLRSALTGQSLGDRVRHEAVARVQDTADEAIAVARESRWIIVATLAALAGWLFRKPLAGLGGRAMDRLPPGEPARAWERFRDWIGQRMTW